jgi:hypothetical protein
MINLFRTGSGWTGGKPGRQYTVWRWFWMQVPAEALFKFQFYGKLLIISKMFKSIIFLTGILINFNYAWSQAHFSEEAGLYGKLLDDLKNDLYENSRIRTIHLDDRDRLMFVSWIRDHIHTMKAYKYWEKDMGSYLDFFIKQSQYLIIHGKGNLNTIEVQFR